MSRAIDNPAASSTPSGGSWRTALLLASIVLICRLVYLVWLCPYELAADEAHYWEWSRRPDLSYYTKGPGVAWVIAVTTRALGSSEWAVRVPAAVASFLCALLLARLGTALHRNDERVGFYAAAAFMLMPVFHGSAQFMTIDGPYYACWLGAIYAAWRLYQGPATLPRFLFLGALLGIGMLFKYTILLLAPGLIVFFVRHPGRLSSRQLAAGITMMLVGMLALASPIFVWNHQHGWPTIAHLIGHTGLPGGDVAPQRGWVWNPLWTLGYVLYPFLVLGPPAGVLIVKGIRDTRRHRAEDPDRWLATVFILYTALPIMVFYGLLSFRTDIELNWAAAGYTALAIPLAALVVTRRETDRRVHSAWRWAIGFGIACALLISFGKVPLQRIGTLHVGRWALRTDRALARVDGHRLMAAEVDKALQDAALRTGKSPFCVASGYSQASLLAFYLPSHPSVRSASSLLGGRESAYDYFADTSLADPDLFGRPALLVGASDWAWLEALYFQKIVPVPKSPGLFIGYDYRGPSREPHMR